MQSSQPLAAWCKTPPWRRPFGLAGEGSPRDLYLPLLLFGALLSSLSCLFCAWFCIFHRFYFRGVWNPSRETGPIFLLQRSVRTTTLFVPSESLAIRSRDN